LNYKNAAEILPADLLEELQRYSEGMLIYIPKASERKAWGLDSGIRKELDSRNSAILFDYNSGMSLSDMAQKYYMSESAVKKVIYRKAR